MYAEFANKILEAPWLFLALIGHALPLLTAVYCLWSLRGYARTTAVLPFIATMVTGAWLEGVTAAIERQPILGGVIISVQLLPGVAVLLAVVAASFADKRICWQAIFAGAFFPLYVVDIVFARRAFGSWSEALGAVGGAGPLDALLLVPIMAVAMNWGIAHNASRLRQHLQPIA